MKLLFKQRLFSWYDSYNVYNEDGLTEYTVKGQRAWGHCLKIYDRANKEIGMIKQQVISFLPKFKIYIGNQYSGCIRKHLTFIWPRFSVDFNGWQVEGDFREFDYLIRDRCCHRIAFVQKELATWSDTYTIDVEDPINVLPALMLVLAIDAEKCSRL